MATRDYTSGTYDRSIVGYLLALGLHMIVFRISDFPQAVKLTENEWTMVDKLYCSMRDVRNEGKVLSYCSQNVVFNREIHAQRQLKRVGVVLPRWKFPSSLLPSDLLSKTCLLLA